MIRLEDKIIKLSNIAKRLEKKGASFEQIKAIILVEAERMNIRPVGSGNDAMDSNHPTPC